MDIMSVPEYTLLTIAGQKVPMVESITMRAKRQVEPVGGYGLIQPQDYREGTVLYEVELNRVRLPISEGFDKLDFFALDNFTVSIHRDGMEIAFIGCRWTEIEETLSSGERLLQKAVLASIRRGVS